MPQYVNLATDAPDDGEEVFYDDTPDDVFDDEVQPELTSDAEIDEMALAAEQVAGNWVDLAARSLEDDTPEPVAERAPWNGQGQPPANPTVGDVEALYARMAPNYPPPSEAMMNLTADDLAFRDEAPIDMATIEAEVTEVMAQRDQPVELTPEDMQRADAVTSQTVVLEWFFKGEGFTRKVDPQQIVSEQFQAAAGAAMLRATKKGIVCPELDAITQRRKRFKKDISFLTLPCDLLRGGQVLVPLANVDAIDQLWQDFKVDDAELLRQFLVVYRREQARAEQLQGPLYNPRHYKSLEQVAAKFIADCRWLALNAPEAMQEISAVSFRQANAHLRAQVAEAGVEMVANLRSEAAGWINWLVEQLAVGEDGKRKSINEDKFADAQRFFALAGNLNVAGDAEFAEVIELGKAAIAGQDVAALKAGKGKSPARLSADALRTEVAAKFEAIKKDKTADWVVNAPAGREVVGLDEV